MTFVPPPIKTMELQLIKYDDITDSVRHFTFKKPSDFTFVGGQFITIFFETEGKKYRRQYSLFSQPSDPYLIISIKYIPNGVGSVYLWSLKPKDVVQAMGPQGTFVIRHPQEKHIFIGTGTGIAPFASMIHHLKRDDTIVIAGHRHVALYENELSHTKHIVCLSQPQDTTKQKQYVQDVVPDFIEQNAQYYICGLFQMIREVVQILRKNGIPMTQIHIERYD